MEMIKNSQPARTLTEIKEEAIKKSTDETKPTAVTKKNQKLNQITKNKYLFAMLIIIFISVVIYLSYQYVRAVSIRIAASLKHGINASDPTYTPDEIWRLWTSDIPRQKGINKIQANKRRNDTISQLLFKLGAR
jgi:hypothetical protein